MNARRSPAPSHGTHRRWHIPPPLVHGAEPLEGGVVLAENPGPVGLVLWQALRDVLLWTGTAPGDRDGLFAPGAAAARRQALTAAAPPGPTGMALHSLTKLLEDPAGVKAEEIGTACASIGEAAEQNGSLATALAFAQDAALAEAEQAAPAFAVARIAVRLGDHARAEVWYRRTIGIARRARDWRLYTRAFSGLGALYRSRGNLPGAHRFHLRALRGARRGGLRVERGVALHDLFGVSVEAGREREAERYAREAFNAYPSGSPRLPALVHDVAYFWMELGHFTRALRLFQAVEPLIQQPTERLWLQADLMRAAAGAGDAPLARRFADQVRAECAQPEMASVAARAQLELARGELQMDNWDGAQEAASTALRLATERRDGRTMLMAESLLDAIRAARTAGGRQQQAADRTQDLVAAGESLAADMIRTLRELAAPLSPGADAGYVVAKSTVNRIDRLEAPVR